VKLVETGILARWQKEILVLLIWECQMPDFGSWDVISGAGSGQIILAVDFPAPRRRDAAFTELAAKLGPGYRFLQTKPPAARTVQWLCGQAYVAPCIESIREDGNQVAALLGYCVGGVYAAAIAAGIARWQPMPKVILFDPQFVSGKYLAIEFLREIDAISSLLSDQEIEHTRNAATRISGSAPCDLADAAAEMAGIYWNLSSLAFERVGIGSTYNNRLIAPFDSYFRWLSTAREIDPVSVWRSSTVIVSSDYAEPSAGGDPVAGAGPIGRQIRFDVGHDDLLRSDSVATTVAGLLEAG
jgi:hypothetical protein